MKKILFVLPLLAATIISTQANFDEGYYKKDTIKFMYHDAIKAGEYDDRADSLDTLYAYSDRELQNAIALTKSDPMSAYQGYANEITPCNEVRDILNLTTGNGYSVDEIDSMDYRVLNNGRVRASIMVTGNEDIDSSNFTDFKDFSLKCEGESCKITDMYNYIGVSGKLEAEKSCR